MIKVYFEVRVEHHDYFDHFRSTDRSPDSRRFESLVDAFNYYKESKSTDYYWPGDHEKITHRPVRKFVYVPDTKQSKHGYVRGYRRNYTRDIEFIERQYLNKPWFKKNYVCDPEWINFYSQSAYMPNEVKCYRIKKEKPAQVIEPEYVFDFDFPF